MLIELAPGLMLVVIIFGFILLLQRIKKIMATVSNIQDRVSAMADDVTRVSGLVKDLHDQVANGTGPATQADLDAIDNALAAVQLSLSDVK